MPLTDSPVAVALASTSRYRRALLERLLSDFRCLDPAVDETPLAGELPAARAIRLARLKAEAGARMAAGCIVIGSDQVASLDQEILRKPGSHARAVAQLEACNGRHVDFYTAVCVLHAGQASEHLDHTQVVFRDSDAQLRHDYLLQEQPYDCAGSFKSEGLGVILMERIDNQDPTALQGLPLIWLARCLRNLGAALL